MKVTSKGLGVTALVLAVLLPLASAGLAQQPARPKRVLVLHWYDRTDPIEIRLDQHFQVALEAAAPGGIEYYTEYLESNKFPAKDHPAFMRDYLRQKYAGTAVDVVVVHSGAPLDFLLQHRGELFPDTPIVFATAGAAPVGVQAAGATGLVYSGTYRETLDLALRLHPGTEELFVISGTLNHDKSFESVARQELEGYKDNLKITYLTDLTSAESRLKLRNPPKKSVALYVWQQALDQGGKVLQTRDFLAQIAEDSQVPIYGMSFMNVGHGIVGGYVWTAEARETRLAELTLKVANGARPADIPIEKAPEIPMFDWRQLQRWDIRPDRLPPGSVIRFRDPTLWQQYKGRIVAATIVFVLQALLIGALLVQRHQVRRSHRELQTYKLHLEKLVQQRTAELEVARDQAVAANRAKSTFLANISHELRTPLNAILGFSHMVLKNSGLSDQQRKDVGIVESSGEHLLSLIDDVVDMAKIESGSVVLENAAMNVSILANSAIGMLRESAQAKNLELRLNLSERVPALVHSDPGRIRQVLANLVGNAIKYTDQGAVVLSVDAQGDDSRQCVLIFDVEDTGIGIAPADQARIFDPFVQAGSPRTRKGTGLGLAISRHLTQLLGGSIQVDSAPGRGSRFHVEIPVRLAEASALVPETFSLEEVAGLASGEPAYRVLIVEDQRENWTLLDRLLQTAGFQVRIAEDGRQAVQAFAAWRPQFIWMDLRLPVMDGMEAAGRIRELEGGRDVKIAAVTASVFASQRDQVLASGFDDFLRKPYRPREIFDCMARHLGVRYRYEAGSEAGASDPQVTLRTEALAALPATVRDELESAVISLSHERIACVIRQISELDPSLAGGLTRLADGLAYTAIFDAVERCKSGVAGSIRRDPSWLQGNPQFH